MTYRRSLERHLKYFGLVDDSGKAITLLHLSDGPSQKPSLLLWRDPGVAPGRPWLRFANVERHFRDELQPANKALRQCYPYRKRRALFKAETGADEI